MESEHRCRSWDQMYFHHFPILRSALCQLSYFSMLRRWARPERTSFPIKIGHQSQLRGYPAKLFRFL